MKEIRADSKINSERGSRWHSVTVFRDLIQFYTSSSTTYILVPWNNPTATTIKVYDRAVYCLYLKCCYGCILYSFSEAIIISRKHTHHVQGLQPLSSPPQRALSLESHHRWAAMPNIAHFSIFAEISKFLGGL